MAGFPTLQADDVSLLTLRKHWRFAFARIKSDPNAAPYVATWTAFGPQWNTTFQKELGLEDGEIDGEAGAVTADRGLDGFGGQLHAVIHGFKKPNPEHPVHQLFFGSKTLSEFTVPLLGKELESALGWPAHLAGSTLPAIQALAPQGTAAVQAADAAAQALDGAIKARELFRLGGERAALFDAFNSLCATTHGGLKAFAHDHPELNLGATYADSFFLHLGKSPHGKTLSVTARASAAADRKAAAAKKKHDAALAAAAAKAADAAARQVKRAEAAQKKKAAEDAVKAARAAKLAAKEAEKAAKKPKK